MSSGTAKTNNICFICLKRFGTHEEDQVHDATAFSGLASDDMRQHPDLYTRFLHVINRHLNLTVVTTRLLAGVVEKKSSEDVTVQAFCGSCREVVSCVCDLYSELNAVKLRLIWKLGELKDMMEKGKKAVSHKLARGLVTSLATQVYATHASSIWLLRKHLAIKCKLKQKGGTPKLQVHRGLFPEHWKFTYSATKKCLMLLIVIFTLASPKVGESTRNTQESQENKPPTKSHGKPRCRQRRSTKFRAIQSNADLDSAKRAQIMIDKEKQDDIEHPVEEMNSNSGDEDIPRDDFVNDSDSDWSRGATSPISARSGRSDEEFSPLSAGSSHTRTRRWNLRKTRNRMLQSVDEKDSSDDYKPHKQITGKRRRGRPKLPQTDFRPRSLPCKQCKKTFMDLRGLNQHVLKIHGSTMQYPCPTCGLKFKRKFEMLIHKQKMHRIIRTNYISKVKALSRTEAMCHVCGEVFASRDTLQIHKKQKHKVRKTRLECPICFKPVIGEASLENHINAHETNTLKDVVIFPCEVCGKNFYREYRLAMHIKYFHEGKFPCFVCNSKCSSAKCLRSHLETHETEKKSFFCTLCFRGFTNHQYYYIHRKVSHNRVGCKNRYFCDKLGCVEEWESIEELNEHLKTHVVETLAKMHEKQLPENAEKEPEEKLEVRTEETKLQPVVIASQEASAIIIEDTESIKIENEDYNMVTSNTHVSNVAVISSNNIECMDPVPEDETAVFKCSECGWGFLKKYTLTLHSLVHTPHSKQGKGYDCPKCGKNCTTLETLCTHYNRLHGEKIAPVKCDECNIYFRSAIYLQKHRRCHKQRKSGKKFLCDVCDAECLDVECLYIHKQQKHPRKKDTGESPGSFEHRASSPPEMKARTKRSSGGRPWGSGTTPRTKEELELKEKGVAFSGKNIESGAQICETCSRSFAESAYLRKHIARSHETDEKNIYCCFCELGFTTKQSCEFHVKDVHRKRKIFFKCDYGNCTSTFQTVNEFNEHLKSHLDVEEEKEHKGPTLDDQTGSMSEQSQPLVTSVIKRTIHHCKLCTLGFFDSYLMKLHELIHLPKVGQQWKCPNCTEVFNKFHFMSCHYNRQHGLNIKPFKCTYCDRKYFLEKKVKEHLAKHKRREKDKLVIENPDTKFICIDCGKEFIDSKSLAGHRKRHDPANHKKCPECDLTFELQWQLIAHLKRKHNHGVKYQCDICGMAFISRSYLKAHILTHQDAQVECETCGKKFKSELMLKKHKKKIHDPNRTPYVCVECGMMYKSDSGLKFHLLSVHTPNDQKKFPCPHCPKRYHRKELLNLHIKSCMRMQGIEVGFDESIQRKDGKNQQLTNAKGTKRKKSREEEEAETTTSESEEEDTKQTQDGKPMNSNYNQIGTRSIFKSTRIELTSSSREESTPFTSSLHTTSYETLLAG
ncbi:unnamed protein product [Orchesella dallaii]|uniref:C2H2-type domain-containing protein n=1 Tax=Orchesella dallaii TaxID=48710 RepID=A0ABP1QFZ8_9HEXA